MTMITPGQRPNPLGDAAKKAGGIWAAVGGLVGALAVFGVLSSAQAEAIATAGTGIPNVLLALGSVIAGVVPILTGLISAFRTSATAKPNVTPSADPRGIDPTTGHLVPLVLSTTLGRHARGDGL